MGLPLGPIQPNPLGLLGLLDLKVLGRLPDELAGFVQPTLDAGPFYLNGRSEQSTAFVHSITLTTGTVGFSEFSPGTLRVPDDEVWYVHDYTVRCTVTAVINQFVRFYAAMAYSSVGSINYTVCNGAQERVIDSNATYAAQAMSSGHDFWAKGGFAFGVYVADLTSAAGAAFTGNYRITRMRR